MTPFNALEKDELNHEEYLWASSATMADTFEVGEEDYTDEEKKQLRCLHGAIGIVTEVGEICEAMTNPVFDAVNLVEELGDVVWYLAIFNREYPNIQKEASGIRLGITNAEVIPHEMSIQASRLLDLYKRRMFYGKGVPMKELTDRVIKIQCLVYLMAQVVKVPLDEIRAINIKKLWTRFDIDYTEVDSQVDLFDKEKAINRDISKERIILEGK